MLFIFLFFLLFLNFLEGFKGSFAEQTINQIYDQLNAGNFLQEVFEYWGLNVSISLQQPKKRQAATSIII